MPVGRWGTITEAALHFGITRQRVHRLVAKGAFQDAKRVSMPWGAVWLLPFPFSRRTLRIGRPPKAEEGRAD